MADDKPTSTFYRNLGGINQKASEYSIDKAQFLYLSNVDFDVPNALSKRPGSTQAIGLNASGPINSLFEFVRLDGSSYVIAGDDSAMRYKTGTSLTLLDAGWTNGQPTDMLTFLNKVWMANGQKFVGWSGVGATPYPGGLPCPEFGVSAINDGSGDPGSPSAILFGGYPQQFYQGAGTTTVISRAAAFVAYSFVRADGTMGANNFLGQARNVIRGAVTAGVGAEQFAASFVVSGITYPSGQGITAIAFWLAMDAQSNNGSSIISGANIGLAKWPNQLASAYGDITMIATASQSLAQTSFYFYTLLPASSFGGTFLLQMTNFLSWKQGYTNLAGGTSSAFIPGAPLSSFNLSQFCWYNTNTPKYIEINQNIMFMAGFSNTPSNVWFSDVGQPEVIQPENFFEVRTNDGDRILATKTYANQLIIMKENSFHKVIGDSAENFELVEVSTRYGCLSNKTVVEYEQRLVWLDKKGILEYNGANYDIISTPVEDIFRRMNVEAAKEKAVAVHEIYRNQIWFGIPIDGSAQNNMTVVYDYLVKAWTFFEGFNAASFAMIKQDLSKGTVWRGSYSGMIYYHGASFLGDNGQGITCLIRPHWDKNKENETWIWRRFFADVGTVTGLTGTLTGRVFSNYDNTTVQATFSMYQDAFQSRAEIGVPAKSVTVELGHYSASLPLLFNGYSWAKRFLRNV